MKFTYVLLVVLLVGCASTATEPTYYLLRSQHDLESRKLNPSRNFSMGSVVIASYIDQPGLVIETKGREMRPAQNHLWAEPLYESVRNQLMAEITQTRNEDILPAALARTPIVLDIRIDQLHGTNEGTAKLVAYWWLRRGKEVQSAYQFSEEQALTADGYDALVAAEEALLTQLAKEIAATMIVTDS